ncbi:hypothetical protein [Nocardia sp. BMG51109]|uniref:hypothetical protein n=1 Tax=Nocardia sp. BMG51109 TaxID=1056816 RepID=UPI0012EC9A9C|nr:hypothetical protein [Nocardia sp. BMG51109]
MNNESIEYSVANLRKTSWGGFRELDDESWETIWHLEFSTPQESLETEVYNDDDIGFRAVLKISSDTAGRLHIFTRESAMSAVNYSPTFKCFGIINDDIAELAKIEGLPKEWYSPFRSRQQDRK